MLNFSELCRHYLTQSESNVYQISKASNLDRTTIQRMITGKRLPSLEFVEAFCDHLRISKAEKKQLIEAYQMEKVGPSIYLNRKYIRSLITHISASQSYPNYYLSLQTKDSPVNEILYRVLDKTFSMGAPGEILTNLCVSYNYFFQALIKLQIKYEKSVPVKHTFSMYPNPMSIPDSNINLEKLYHLVPFLFTSYQGYEPYYYYSRFLKIDSITQLFPYYIITKQCVIFFSSDLKKFHIIEEKDCVTEYRNQFHKTLLEMKPLITKIKNPLEALEYYITTLDDHGIPTHSIEPQPCIFSMLSSLEDLALLCPPGLEHREILLEKAVDFYNKFNNALGSYKNICSLEAFQELGTDGTLYGAFTRYTEKIPPKQRASLIRNFFQVYDRYPNFYFADSSFHVPKDLQIELCGQKQMHIVSTKDDHFSFLVFQEASICQSLCDFAESLCNDDSVYPKETVHLLFEQLAK